VGEAQVIRETNQEMHGTELRRQFLDFNRLYFAGRLPRYRIRCVDRLTWLGQDGSCNNDRRLIRICKGLDEQSATSTLLHEMVHAAVGGGHGKRFRAKIAELKATDAPLQDEEGNFTMPTDRVTAVFFRCTLEDVLLVDRAPLVLNAALRWFIHEYGGASSIADFLRRYPWAKRVYAEVKRKAARFWATQARLRQKLEALRQETA